jgi:two-component system, chemotaxis family, sensor kinase CheA
MQDPLKYFRIEAREILEQLQSGLLELERNGTRQESMQRLLRLAHTLKGAARVVKQLEIAKLAHQLEDLLVPFREVERALAASEVEALLASVDAIARGVGALAAAPAPDGPKSAETPATAGRVAEPAEEPLRALTAPLEHVDTLTEGVAELGFQLGSVRRAVPELAQTHRLAEQLSERLEPQRLRELNASTLVTLRALAGELETRLGKLEREVSTSLERATRELGQVRDRVDQLRLVAAASIFGTLERTARDAAVSLGKQTVFEAHGGDIRLEAEVLTAVQRALVQAVRNAVAHGIEPSAERGQRGKQAQGHVTVAVERRGRQICFSCRDDGRGVNLAEVRREAERLGRLDSSKAAATEGELLELLLRGGISTTPRVTEVSGRGVGLDLIREALAGVGGSVALSTEPGAGTNLTLMVPASLAALEALVVEAGGELQAIPLSAVVQALRLSTAELSHTTSATSLLFEGQVVPFVPLAWLLRSTRQGNAERAVWSTVIVRGKLGLLALGVDRLLGSESLVARGLPDAVEVDATVAGVTLDADGNPRLLLDPDELVAAATQLPERPSPDLPRQRAILVVDDSLTTRMLEQSILESAGYAVELATSGEQGLEKARAGSYDLFLVDVEMPNMDGFSFVEQVRADPQLRQIPAVLVTSRASAEDLARGKAAGASGHIAKGEFDQLDFLERIERLMR